MNKTHLLYFLFLTLFATSCSNTKYLPEGDLLYIGAKVKVEGNETSKKEEKALKTALKDILRPKPNSSFLGLRPKLYIYNLAGTPKKEKGWRHWLKTKVGEPPVLYSQVDLEYSKSVVQNFSENSGYFNAETTADSTRKGKKATAEYSVKPDKQYKIREVKFPTDSSLISSAVRNTRRRSLLKKDQGYSLDAIKLERIRIDARLKEKGFFYFNPDYLKVQVDSTVADHQVDLIVKVKEETPKLAETPFKINKIIVYPNYSIGSDSLKTDFNSIKKYNDFTIIDPENLFKPRIFDRVLYFKKEDLYNRTNHNLSLNRLVNLGTFKFVKNQFRVSDTIGNYLDAYYYLTPLPKKSIRMEVLAKTNSANYTGTELNLNWSNRNTFRGAELLTISAFGGVEVQVSGQNNGFNVYRVGTEANLVWPRFVSPFKLNPSSGFVPKTKATLGYEFQNRTKLYSLQTFKGSFGYLWKENERKEHVLNVTEITYASPQNVTPLYQEQILANASLGKVIEKQLIFGPSYSYTYTNTLQRRKKNTFYYKGTIDLAGNIAGLVTGANIQKGDTIKLFDVPFSQFVKIENDFRHYLKLGPDLQLASRIIVGAGFAYGNSREMPFIKQFFIGGTNSLRAFRARSIGPGSFDGSATTSSFLADQSGDLKLEFNTEYRAKIYDFVKGALFVDAGNIWLLKDNPEKPGAQFSKKFLNEIAVGTGAGLRFDFSFLILRTDFAFPIRKPYLPDGERWVLDKISFGNGSWRKENLVFNLAIGYPF
ncbi:translocation and assembly module lipoprotein TamL [Flavobacterium gawalongense]|uniref:BamA/TamA family outer membrane protein n=1 Tax=Flavobacterium gawalongense TaxID=2594432 RepID=A0ABY3CPQ9_9FLAO|nr:BamA/TamA family outer membrane protein [Flavobacterium gawalongense]TRX03167.1 BamA/TamA family outer membrane protein [Flavobacterium gawalongense]TRX09829.1 BamA/TamA family outer membrane protein [Flavobacterium gawalongense]